MSVAHRFLGVPSEPGEIEELNDFVVEHPKLEMVGHAGQTDAVVPTDDGGEMRTDAATGKCPACGDWTYFTAFHASTECCGHPVPTEVKDTTPKGVDWT